MGSTNRITGLIAAGLGVGLASCQSDYRANATNVASSLQGGSYEVAAAQAAGFLDDCDDRDRAVVLMEAARTAQVAGDLEASTNYYLEVDELLRPYLSTKPDALVSEVVSATIVNQTMSTYRGTPGERIMLCTLLAINRLAAGDLANARIDLNRAHDWQQAAVAHYEAEINSEQSALESASRGKGRDVSGARHHQGLAPLHQSVEDLRGYADFANPFSTYLRGVFLLATSADAGDLSNARSDFRAVLGMAPVTAPVVDSDIAAVEAAQRGELPPTTWVFVMGGLGPYYEEFRLDVPIPFGQVNYVSAAFPVFKRRTATMESFMLRSGELTAASAPLCDLDQILGAEYRIRLPGVITQELASSAAKTAATWAASSAARSGGNNDAAALVMIAGWIYQAGSTAADLRGWRSLPQRIAVARLATPADGLVNVVGADGNSLCSLSVDAGRNNIVVVTLPSAHAPPSIQMAQLATGLQQAPPAATVQPRDQPLAAPISAAEVQPVATPVKAVNQPVAAAATAPAAVAAPAASSSTGSADRGRVVRVRPGNAHSTKNGSGGPR